MYMSSDYMFLEILDIEKLLHTRTELIIKLRTINYHGAVLYNISGYVRCSQIP